MTTTGKVAVSVLAAAICFGLQLGSALAESKRILVYGDSNTYGWTAPGTRHGSESRWGAVMGTALGGEYEVIEAGLSGRTTDIADNSLYGGAGFDGSASLQGTIAENMPLDLVVIMLGTNDYKAPYNRSALRVALGAGKLIDQVNQVGGGAWTNFPTPRVLLVAPPAIGPNLANNPAFVELFAGGIEKSEAAPAMFEKVAQMADAAFFDANSVASADAPDGIHMSADAQRKLGHALADKVLEILK